MYCNFAVEQSKQLPGWEVKPFKVTMAKGRVSISSTNSLAKYLSYTPTAGCRSQQLSNKTNDQLARPHPRSAMARMSTQQTLARSEGRQNKLKSAGRCKRGSGSCPTGKFRESCRSCKTMIKLFWQLLVALLVFARERAPFVEGKSLGSFPMEDHTDFIQTKAANRPRSLVTSLVAPAG